jgi:hypothetical protein
MKEAFSFQSPKNIYNYTNTEFYLSSSWYFNVIKTSYISIINLKLKETLSFKSSNTYTHLPQKLDIFNKQLTRSKKNWQADHTMIYISNFDRFNEWTSTNLWSENMTLK